MNTLLIGKRGQLGSALEHVLLETGGKVYAFDHHELDVTDYERTNATIRTLHPDTIINTSAYHVLRDCELYPENAFAVNAFALRNLAEVCREEKIRLVTYSTDYVFDGTKGDPYVEDDRTNPLQLYGMSKLAGEIICLNYHTNSIVIRTCGVYGGKTGSNQKKGNFVLSILQEAKQKAHIEVSVEQIVSPTYAEDLAASTVALLAESPTGGVYHLINEGHCSWFEFAKEIITIKRLSTQVISVDRKGKFADVRRPLFSALRNIKAKTLGITLPPWQKALRRFLS